MAENEGSGAPAPSTPPQLPARKLAYVIASMSATRSGTASRSFWRLQTRMPRKRLHWK
jgi:hypothetical protein